MPLKCSRPCASIFLANRSGQFADQVLAEVEADREVLAKLTERVGGTAGGMKEWGAWLAEKVSRLKLKHGSADGLGTFEALEFLVIGIHGKWALWRAMAEVASFDSRLQGIDFRELIARAENQHQQVEERRLACAQSVFRPGESDGRPRPHMQSTRGAADGSADPCERLACEPAIRPLRNVR